MRKIFSVLAIAALAVLATSCGASRAQQMAMADNVQITCNPEVLATVGDNIPADITVTYPDGYFAPKAMLKVTPVLVYEGGEQEGETFVYQGVKVKDNYKVIPSDGGTVKEHVNFTYTKGVEKSHLELRGVVVYGGKTYDVPAIKVADGVNTTARWASTTGVFSAKEDEYQDVIHETAEGQIKYDVNSANVKNSELRSQSIRELQEALKGMEENERYTVKGTKVIAYASPEGGQSYNAKLSDKRAGTAEKAWEKISGEKGDVEVQSIGQDWQGFQDAIEKSNIDDKDLILRVLSMYSDPAVREKEIRNMSQVYTEINKKVFPDLRRARFVTEADYRNFSNEELAELAEKAIGTLDAEALLRVASLTKDEGRKVYLLERAAETLGSEKAMFNLATMSLAEGNVTEAADYLAKIKNVDGDVLNAKGVVELRKGNEAAAVKLFNQAGTAEANENLAVIDIKNGRYNEAARRLEGATGHNAAVAFILTGQYDKAAAALTCECPKSDYLRAVVAARKGDKEGVKKNLDAAASKNEAFKTKAENDVEFAKYL